MTQVLILDESCTIVQISTGDQLRDAKMEPQGAGLQVEHLLPKSSVEIEIEQGMDHACLH